MARIVPARRSRWRRTQPTGLVPALPPPRRQEPGDDARGDGAAPSPGTGEPGQASTVVATTTPAEGAAQVASSTEDGRRRRPALRPSMDPPAAIPPPTAGTGSSRVRVLHTAGELDDARARAAEQARRISEAMGPLSRRAEANGPEQPS